MTTIICQDKRDGVLFNRRRLSKDSEVIRRIALIAKDADGCLYVSPYTGKMLQEYSDILGDVQLHIVPNPEVACKDGICFLEDTVRKLHPPSVDRLILINWNREYPSDTRFNRDGFFQLTGRPWKLSRQIAFCGTSHNDMFLDIYLPTKE